MNYAAPHRIRLCHDCMRRQDGVGAISDLSGAVCCFCHGSALAKALPLSSASRSHTAMGEVLERIIRRSLDEARAKGRDYLTQTELAVRTGQQVRPDVTASEIPATVSLFQNQ